MEFIKSLLAITERNYEKKDNFCFTAQLGNHESIIQREVETGWWRVVSFNTPHLGYSTMEAAIRAEVNALLRSYAKDVTNFPFICYNWDGDKMEVRPCLGMNIEYVLEIAAFVVCANAEDIQLFERLLEVFNCGWIYREFDDPADCARLYYWREGYGNWVEPDDDDPMAKYIIKQHFKK